MSRDEAEKLAEDLEAAAFDWGKDPSNSSLKQEVMELRQRVIAALLREEANK